MKRKSLLSSSVVFLLCTFLFLSNTLASWAYSFVVWDGYLYVVTEETVNEIDKEIGHVTKYSDKEGTYSGNFSNSYPKGTKYFAIVGVSTDEAIAVEDVNEKYLKATRDGKYAGGKQDLLYITITVWILIGSFIVFLVFALLVKEKRLNVTHDAVKVRK